MERFALAHTNLTSGVQESGQAQEPRQGTVIKRIFRLIVSTALLIIPLIDSEAPHLVLQGCTLQSEAFGCAAATRDLPGRSLQCVEDYLSLGVMERRRRRGNIIMRRMKLSNWHF